MQTQLPFLIISSLLFDDKIFTFTNENNLFLFHFLLKNKMDPLKKKTEGVLSSKVVFNALQESVNIFAIYMETASFVHGLIPRR